MEHVTPLSTPRGPASRRRAHRRRGEAGFSLVEVLFASVLMLMVLIGILPLFLRAMVNNSAGRDSTTVSNFAKSEVEQLFQLPFDSPELVVDAGTEGVTVEYWDDTNEKWTPDAPTEGDALWTRTARIRQYGFLDLTDNKKLDSPLAGGTNDRSIHIKEIEVTLESGRDGGPLASAPELTVRMLKSF